MIVVESRLLRADDRVWRERDGLCRCLSGLKRHGTQPETVSPVAGVAASVMLSVVLPRFERLIVVVTGDPGVEPKDEGLAETVTASIAGTVNATFWVCVMAGFVVLVAVTVNVNCVPAAGICPVGCR